jgi:hypothetical protein
MTLIPFTYVGTHRLFCHGRVLPRELNKPLPPERDEARYIVFDGDVDAVRG